MMVKRNKGFTLIEAAIALALLAILTASILFIVTHTSNRSVAMLERQNAFENARSAMDMLITNIQMANAIYLSVEDFNDYSHVLRELRLPSFNTLGQPHTYQFNFNIRFAPNHVRRHRLEFGGNELASNIAFVRIQPIAGRHMHITVRTGCNPPINIEGSVDIRYKRLIINGIPWTSPN